MLLPVRPQIFHTRIHILFHKRRRGLIHGNFHPHLQLRSLGVQFRGACILATSVGEQVVIALEQELALLCAAVILLLGLFLDVGQAPP